MYFPWFPFKFFESPLRKNDVCQVNLVELGPLVLEKNLEKKITMPTTTDNEQILMRKANLS